MRSTKLLTAAIVLFAASAVFGQTATTGKKPSTAKLPPVSEVLANYVKAIGGAEANRKIAHRATKGTLELIPMGVTGTFEETAAAPDKIVSKLTLQGIGDLLEGYDGTTGWSTNPIQGSRERVGNELVQTKLNSTFHRDIELEKHYSQMEVKGIEKVGAGEAYVVVGTPKGLGAETFYFDTKSGLLVRKDAVAISPEGEQNASTFFEDYREVDGIMLPHRMRIKTAQMEMVANVSEFKHGGKSEPAVFQKPKQ